jgi:hypothetical protein
MVQVTPNTQESLTLSNTSLNDIVQALKICYLGDNRFKYSEEQLSYWAKELKNDFKDNLYSGLVAIIRNGIKGHYKIKNTHITLSVIYEWIKEHKTKGKIEIPEWRSGKVTLTHQQYMTLTEPQKRDYNQIIMGI